MLREIQSKSELTSRLTRDGYVLVIFSATWCGPCKFIHPDIEEMAETYKDALFLEVDVDKCDALANDYGVESLPTVLLFRGGKRLEFLVGPGPAKLRELRTKYFDSNQ